MAHARLESTGLEWPKSRLITETSAKVLQFLLATRVAHLWFLTSGLLRTTNGEMSWS